ncbi:MAG TPA: ribonuclease III [Anaeromyxobacteraceae bacterium]|nr:ribonuclease III [Anaeromyxobacteraceae bacterium]
MSDDAIPRREFTDPVTELEARLGLRFADRAVALAAVTHKSYVNEHRGEGLTDNERLEFLGDAVIDLAVSHRLMARFPAAREGDLSKMRAAVVDETGLSEMARALGLGELLRLGRGEELTGGRGKASLLADAMEAVIAALFLGAGLEPVLALVDRFLGEAFQRAAAGTLDRDFKTQLQELAQSRYRATPRYRVVAEHGPDHSKTFEVELELRGEILGRGKGRSKKDAEQAAAKLAYDELVRRCEAEGAPVVKEPPVVDAAPPPPVPVAAAPEPEPEPMAVNEPEPLQRSVRPDPVEGRTAVAPDSVDGVAEPRPRRTRATKRPGRAQAHARAPAGKAAARARKPAPKRTRKTTTRRK